MGWKWQPPDGRALVFKLFPKRAPVWQKVVLAFLYIFCIYAVAQAAWWHLGERAYYASLVAMAALLITAIINRIVRVLYPN